jgi:hypothetical protein
VLKEADGLLLDELVDHIAENSTDGIEALIGLADVREANVIQQNLLHDEDSDSLAQLRTGLHDTETQRDDLGCQKEVDHFRRIILNECANDTKRCEAEVLKRP